MKIDMFLFLIIIKHHVRTYEKKTVPQFCGVNNCDEATGKWIENLQGEVKFEINRHSYTLSTYLESSWY